MGLRRDRSLACNEIQQVEHVEEGRTIRAFPPTSVYPLIVPVSDGYESDCSIRMSEPRCLKPYVLKKAQTRRSRTDKRIDDWDVVSVNDNFVVPVN